MAHPTHRCYTVIKRSQDTDKKGEQNGNEFWLNIGVAFAHEDGKGFNILLQAMPLDGKIVLRDYKEEKGERETENRDRGRGQRR